MWRLLSNKRIKLLFPPRIQNWHRSHWYTFGLDSVPAAYPGCLYILMMQRGGPVKRQYNSARLHGVISLETLILMQYRTDIWGSRFLWNVGTLLRDQTASQLKKQYQVSGLRPLTCWDRGFESHRGHGYLSVVSVVCCQVEVSATSWSLVQRSPTDCAASLCVI